MPYRVRTNRLFPNHGQIGTLFEDTVLTPNTPATETAEQYLSIPDPANPGQFFNYAFLFWNIAGSVSTGLTKTYTVPATDYVATAWYVQVGGGGGGGTGLTVWAFSSKLDLVPTDTPIQSVTPSAAWAGGNTTFVSTTVGKNPVVVTARNTVAGAPGESFANWFPLGVGSPAGNQLTVPNGAASWALAVYAVQQGPKPKIPQIELMDELQSILGRILENVGDPAPIDLARITHELTKSVVTGAEDELSKVLANIETASKEDVRAALVQVQTRVRRLEGAQKLLDAALKERK